MDNKNVFIAIALSMSVLLFWGALFETPQKVEKNLPNQNGILRSKAVGEPPFILSNAVYFATKQAIMSARADAGHMEYVAPDAPLNVDLRQQYCLVSEERFVLPN